MGKNATKIILALAALFVVVAVVQISRQTGDRPAGAEARPLFPGLDLGAVAAVQLDRGGQTLTLEKGEGGRWGVAERGGYPVDGEKLRRLVLGVARLEARDRLTDNPEKYPAVGLGETPEGGTVTLRDAGGAELAVLRVGKRKVPKGGAGASGQFVRAGDDPAVYLVASAPVFDTAPTGWIDRKLLDLPADQVLAVTVERDRGGFTASRARPADPLTLQTPLPKGRSADSGKLGDLGRALVNLTADDALADDDPAVAELSFPVTFAVDTAERVRYTVRLAEKEDMRYARLAAEALPAPEAAAEPEAEDAEKADAAGAEDAADQPDPAATAAAFNERHRGWTYPIPRYAYDRLDTSLDGLLAEPEAGDK